MGGRRTRATTVGARVEHHGMHVARRRAGTYGAAGHVGGFVWPTIFLLIVAGDQLSKALAPKSWVYLDPGAGTLWPSFVSHAFQSSAEGAVLDALAVCVLGALGLVAARSARHRLSRAGTTVLLAGMSSNLLDRLGLASLTRGVHGRFVVNWFDLGAWRIYVGNVADCCYVVGCALLMAAACAFIGRHYRRPVFALVPNVVQAGPESPVLREANIAREAAVATAVASNLAGSPGLSSSAA